MTTELRQLDLLLVEDDPGDVLLIREAFAAHGTFADRLHHASDGAEALSFLRREAPYEDVPVPDLILLDLNLPRKDGREVLAQIKIEESLKRIPVVVLTTSQDEQDVLKSYNLHANCYITKPVDLDQFIKVVRSIEDFWLGIVVLPVNGRG